MCVCMCIYVHICFWTVVLEKTLESPLDCKEIQSVHSEGDQPPLEEGMATHSSILAWRIPWTVQCMGSQRVRQDWVTFTFIALLPLKAILLPNRSDLLQRSNVLRIGWGFLYGKSWGYSSYPLLIFLPFGAASLLYTFIIVKPLPSLLFPILIPTSIRRSGLCDMQLVGKVQEALTFL